MSYFQRLQHIHFAQHPQSSIVQIPMKKYEKDIASLPSLDIIQDSDERTGTLPAEYFCYRGKYFFYRADEFARDVGIYDGTGALDIEATAERLFMPVRYNDMLRPRAYISGIHPHRNILKQEIVLSTHDRDTRVSFGHELGHLYLQEMNWQAHRELKHLELEVLCDFIGRRIALPAEQLAGLESITEATLLDLSCTYKVPVRTVLLRLIEEELLPDRVFVDTYLPDLPNPDYSHKITRCSVCLMCSMLIEHSDALDNEDHALFDFTDRAWGSVFPRCPSNLAFDTEECDHLTQSYARQDPQLALFPPQ